MHNQKILIVEDNFITSDEIKDRLQNLGYNKIETAFTGDEAIAKNEIFRADLILMDINLGQGMDGIEAVSQIHSRHNTPVIYLTAYVDNNTIIRAKISEPYAYIIKPFEERELNIAIEIALYKHESEKKLAYTNKRLKESNATKDKFFSIIAHDLKNPMTHILGYSRLLMENAEKLDIEGVKKYSTTINRATEQISGLLENLLEWSRLQSNTLQHNPTNFSIRTIAIETVGANQEIAQNKGIKLFSLVTEDYYAFADRNMITTVIRNLISNAIKFTSAGGQVYINAMYNNDYVEITVGDTGVGIPESTLPKLFRIDQHVSTPGTASETGTGLGLILCKDFIEKNNGEIQVKSKLNEGSKFIFRLKKGKAMSDISGDSFFISILDDIKNEADISSELITLLKNTFIPRFAEQHITASLNDMIQLSNDLATQTEKYKVDSLNRYCQFFMECAERFELKKIMQVVDSFPAVVELLNKNLMLDS